MRLLGKSLLRSGKMEMVQVYLLKFKRDTAEVGKADKEQREKQDIGEQKKKKVRFIKRVFLLWIVYAVICLVIPPLFHKTVSEQEAAYSGRAGQQERVLSIDDNMDALLWRLRLINAAQERIVLCTFDFRDDDSGRDIMAALFQAAERGVDVRIMVDGINGTLYLTGSGNFRELAAHENVQVKFYNPVNLLLPWKINYRMHDKYLIADDYAYILGGRNTNNLFLGNYADSYNEDRDILVYETVPGEGCSYRQLQQYFDQIWNLPCAEPYRITVYGKGVLEEHYLAVRETYPEAFAEIEWEKETVETQGIELCTNPMKPENKSPQLWDRLIKEMEQGKDIVIQTPYIICSRAMYQDLTDITNEAEVGLIINAVEGGANPFGCTDYLNQRNRIHSTGIHTYEYLGGQALHTKTILIENNISIVGSCNLDMRSVYLDTEMMLVIDCEELNASIRSQTEELKEHSRHIFPNGTVEDGIEYQPVEQGISKKIFYGILRVLIFPFRHLL